MEHPNSTLIRKLYESRNRGDLDGVRSMLAEDIVWHEPELGTEHTGDLHGLDAVLGMIGEAGKLTNGTFCLVPTEVVANGEHAVAMVDWSAERDGRRLEGKEVAIYRIRAGRVVEVSFHQDDTDLDKQFWG